MTSEVEVYEHDDLTAVQGYKDFMLSIGDSVTRINEQIALFDPFS